MGNRTVPFDDGAICDVCGKVGAYDFMGDLLCPECAGKCIEHESCNRWGYDTCICGE